MHGGLYQALVRALEPRSSGAQGSQQERHATSAGGGETASGPDTPSGSAGQEAQRVGRALRRDMERAGIHMAGAARARLDALTARTHELGLAFGPSATAQSFCPAQFCNMVA